jgi:hypothetical protein
VDNWLNRHFPIDGPRIEEIEITDVDIDDPAFESFLVGRTIEVLLKDVDLPP